MHFAVFDRMSKKQLKILTIVYGKHEQYNKKKIATSVVHLAKTHKRYNTVDKKTATTVQCTVQYISTVILYSVLYCIVYSQNIKNINKND